MSCWDICFIDAIIMKIEMIILIVSLSFLGKILFEQLTLPMIPKLSIDETITIQTHLDLSRRAKY
jgi:hypothetical protein